MIFDAMDRMTAEAELDHGRKRLFTALIPPVVVVVLLWIVFAFDQVYQLGLYHFGVYPRRLSGLLGIIGSPFVHDDLEHLVSNSAPILVLGWLLVYFYPKAAWRVTLASWAMGGLWVWTTARESFHIGASGIIYGLAAFLFFSGVFRRRVALMAVSLIVVFLYGGMIWGVLPIDPHISWESHLFGGLAGAIMSWFYRRVPPAHVPPPIVLEDEPEEVSGSAEDAVDGTDVGPGYRRSGDRRLTLGAKPIGFEGDSSDDIPLH